MPHSSSSSEQISPFTPPMFHILLVLADHESHGYAIMQEVAQQSAGSVRLAPGTLYRSIKHLLDSGLIAESDARPDPTLDDERRRYYQITPHGRQAAMLEAGRLARLVSMAEAKHLLPTARDSLVEGME